MGLLAIQKLLGYEIVAGARPAHGGRGPVAPGRPDDVQHRLIGEMDDATYFESQNRRIYAVRQILTRKQHGVPGGAKLGLQVPSPAPMVLRKQPLHRLPIPS